MKRIICSVFVILVCLSGNLFSQANEQKLKEIFLDAEFFFMYQNYSEALYQYNTLYNNGYKDNANINYRIGICYLNIAGQKQKAIPYLEMASANPSKNYEEGAFKETKAPYEAVFYLGNAYRINNQFDKSIAAYQRYKELIDKESPLEGRYANVGIESCRIAPEEIKNPEDVRIKNLGRPICTVAKDFFPAIDGNESLIVYNSSQKFYDAIFFSKKTKNQWSTPLNITPDVQSDGDQYVSSLSFDGTTLFLRKEDNFDADIYVSYFKEGKWTKSQPINKNINTKFLERNAFISKDGKTLYFSSNRTGSLGELDIFSSSLLDDGTWGTPINLGNNINTEFNEDYPSITEDGKRLYFASQGHATLGGYDIFYCELKDDGTWGEPVNLGYPVNTTDDELVYAPKNTKVAYTSKYSNEGFGNEDIFKIEFPPYEAETPATIAKVVDTVKQVAEVKKVLQEVEKRPVADSLKIVVLNSLFFEFNSSDLNTKSIEELNKLYRLMNENTEVKIVLVGCADAIGSSAYNQSLSNRRSMSAKSFLVKKGIKPSRIATVLGKGYIARNQNSDKSDCPEGRALNRRVDIRFSTPVSNAKIETPIVPSQLQIIQK
jgi:outer membrane protein OmpA-like peptidoglycan-associated protein